MRKNNFNKMGVATGITILKFINYGVFALIIVGVIAGAINGFVHYRKTGDSKMLIDKTLGEVVLWDSKIYISMEQLLNEELINKVPEEVRGEYASTLAKNILIHVFLFAVLLYLLFRFGNWVVGLAQFTPITDLAIIFVSLLLVFVFIPLIYGYTMKVDVTLFKGVYLWLSNLGLWWQSLGGGAFISGTPTITNAIENTSNVIPLGG